MMLQQMQMFPTAPLRWRKASEVFTQVYRPEGRAWSILYAALRICCVTVFGVLPATPQKLRSSQRPRISLATVISVFLTVETAGLARTFCTWPEELPTCALEKTRELAGALRFSP